MNAATLDELRELRERAYGPAADIDGDPAALRRLRELEARHTDAAAPPPANVDALLPKAESRPAQAPSADTDPPRPPADEAPAVRRRRPREEPDAPTAAAEPRRPDAAPALPPAGATPATPARARLRPRTRVLWALSVVAAAALAAGATYALTSMAPVSASSGAPQIATLEPDSLITVPAGWFGAGPSSKAFEFYGLTLFETAGGMGPGTPGSNCFTVMATEDLPEPDADTTSWSTQGAVYYGCGVGAFPATVQFAVDSNAPEALRARFTDDSALQFVFDGDRVGVFLDSE